MKHQHTFTIATSTDWQAVRADGLGTQGTVVMANFAMAVGPPATAGNLECKLVDSQLSASASQPDLSSVAIGDTAYHETGVALSGGNSFTVNVSGSSKGDAASYIVGGSADASEAATPLLMVRGDGTLEGDVTVTIRALNYESQR